MKFLFLSMVIVIVHTFLMLLIDLKLRTLANMNIVDKEKFKISAVRLLADSRQRHLLLNICKNSREKEIKDLLFMFYVDYGVLGLGVLLVILFWFRVI